MPKLLTHYIQQSSAAIDIALQHYEGLLTEMQERSILSETEVNAKRTAFHARLLADAPEIIQAPTSLTSLHIPTPILSSNVAAKMSILEKIDDWFWQPKFASNEYQALDEFFLSLSNHVNQSSVELQTRVNTALDKATDILNSAGSLSLSVKKSIKIDVINQVTDEKMRVELPVLRANGQSLHHNTMLVDRIMSETNCYVTIFQRIEHGFVRIATNVRTADSKRATNTFIPNESPVVRTILKGETFRGSAFVVNNWHATAYTPIEIDGQIAAILYVGAQEYLPQINQRISNVRFRAMLEQLADAHFSEKKDGSIITKLIQFFSEAQQSATGNPFMELGLKELTVVLKQIKEQRSTLKSNKIKHPLSKATDFIQKNLEKNISIDELAAIEGISKPTLYRYFKENYAQSPLNYLNNERLNCAVALIVSKKKTVAEAGRTVGISDTSYFIKLFKQRFGVTPKQYFKQNSAT